MEIMPYTVAVQVMKIAEAGRILPTLWKCNLSFTFNAHSQLLEMQFFYSGSCVRTCMYILYMYTAMVVYIHACLCILRNTGFTTHFPQ